MVDHFSIVVDILNIRAYASSGILPRRRSPHEGAALVVRIKANKHQSTSFRQRFEPAFEKAAAWQAEIRIFGR
jgi:hypothetical protein